MFLPLLLCLSFHLCPYTALNEVESMNIRIGSPTSADTPNTIHLTLWHNYTIYQYSFTRAVRDASYIAYKQSSPLFTAFAPSDCTSNIPQTKMMVEVGTEDPDNSVWIDKMSFTTSSGVWYGIDQLCIDSSVAASARDPLLIHDSECPSNHLHFEYLCVDHGDCAPYKQMIYFDTLKPNQYITDAAWTDATNVTPHIQTCSPTTTANPTNNPTLIQTYSTKSTVNPTKHPTSSPSFSTNKPTVYPTKPGSLSCGEQVEGAYNGEYLIFETSIPFDGDIIFDATASDFAVTVIEGYNATNYLLDTDDNHDQVLTLQSITAGIYSFRMYGGTGTGFKYNVKILCISDNPTPAPTHNPTKHPTPLQTDSLIIPRSPTRFPSHIINVPTVSPTNISIMIPTLLYRYRLGILIILLVVSLVCCLLCCIVMVKCRKREREVIVSHVNVTEMASNEMDTIATSDRDKHEVKLWLNKIGFGEYYSLFVDNGFESMLIIRSIDEEVLNEMGINNFDHQRKIWIEINKMKHNSMKHINVGENLNRKVQYIQLEEEQRDIFTVEGPDHWKEKENTNYMQQDHNTVGFVE